MTTLLYFLNPTQTRQIDYAILTITEEKLMDEWTINYDSVSVIIDGSKIGDVDLKTCFSVPNGLGLTGNTVVKDESGNNVDSGINGAIDITHTSGNRFYKIYASDDFNLNDYSCSAGASLIAGEYTYGALANFDVVLKENLYDFIDEYNADYVGLKERLELTNDFMVFIYDQDINLLKNASIFVPRVVEVVARDIPVVALDKDANPFEVIINIRTW